jgi:hypothetical protein
MGNSVKASADAKIYSHAEKLGIKNLAKASHKQILALSRSLGHTDAKFYSQAEKLGIKNAAKATPAQTHTILKSLVNSTPVNQPVHSGPVKFVPKPLTAVEIEQKKRDEGVDKKIYEIAEAVGIKNVHKAHPDKLKSFLRQLFTMAPPPVQRTNSPLMEFSQGVA